jgi:hypothetical protein
MPIKIANAPVKPSVVFDQVHLRELRIVLADENISKSNVRIVYSLFGRDADGIKHMDRSEKVLEIQDAFVEAAVKAEAGNPALAMALSSIEGAIAALLNESGQYGAVTMEA